jgi:hypothetical protein
MPAGTLQIAAAGLGLGFGVGFAVGFRVGVDDGFDDGFGMALRVVVLGTGADFVVLLALVVDGVLVVVEDVGVDVLDDVDVGAAAGGAPPQPAIRVATTAPSAPTFVSRFIGRWVIGRWVIGRWVIGRSAGSPGCPRGHPSAVPGW